MNLFSSVKSIDAEEYLITVLADILAASPGNAAVFHDFSRLNGKPVWLPFVQALDNVGSALGDRVYIQHTASDILLKLVAGSERGKYAILPTHHVRQYSRWIIGVLEDRERRRWRT